jgi:hypothetical protein
MQTVRPEIAALSTCPESQLIIAISLKHLPASVFKMVEHDLARRHSGRLVAARGPSARGQ